MCLVGRCPICVWKVSGLFLVSGRCLEDVWKASEIPYVLFSYTHYDSCGEGVNINHRLSSCQLSELASSFTTSLYVVWNKDPQLNQSGWQP